MYAWPIGNDFVTIPEYIEKIIKGFKDYQVDQPSEKEIALLRKAFIFYFLYMNEIPISS